MLRDLPNRHAVLYQGADAGKVRRGILGPCCTSGVTGAVTASSLLAGSVIIWSTRGFRTVDGVLSVTAGLATGRFELNSASAVWRALAIRSRSPPRSCGCCWRLIKACSEWFMRWHYCNGAQNFNRKREEKSSNSGSSSKLLCALRLFGVQLYDLD